MNKIQERGVVASEKVTGLVWCHAVKRRLQLR